MSSVDILKIDARFVSLLKWLGENRINVRLSGENRAEGYAVYRIREIGLWRRQEAFRRGRLSPVHDRAASWPASAPSGRCRTRKQEESRGQHEAYQHPEHHGFHELRGADPAGQYPALGQTESGGGPVHVRFPGGAAPRSAGACPL